LRNNSSEKVYQFKTDHLFPVYLIHGEDHSLLRKNLQALMDALIPSEYRDGNLLEQSDKDFDAQEIMDFCNTLPFLYHKRIALIENCPFFYESKKKLKKGQENPDVSFVKWLESNLDNKPTFCIVFTLLEDNDKIKLSQTSALAKLISKKGKVYTFPLPEEIVQFIELCAASRQAEALRIINRLFAQGIDPDEICYRLMARLRYYLKKNMVSKISGNSRPSALKSEILNYVDTLDAENRLRPREMDLISEDPLYILEEWILKDQRCINRIE
jgi:DNA polymerase III delta subunit